MTGIHVADALFAAHVGGDGTHALVRLIGELDVASAPRAAEAIARAEQSDPRTLELDLSALAFMDSTGLRLLLCARERALVAHRRLLVRRGPDAVQRVFEATALTEQFAFIG